MKIKEGKMSTSQQYLGKSIKVKIDRPLGSFHPKYGFIYPVNYGYIPNTVSGDGEELESGNDITLGFAGEKLRDH